MPSLNDAIRSAIQKGASLEEVDNLSAEWNDKVEVRHRRTRTRARTRVHACTQAYVRGRAHTGTHTHHTHKTLARAHRC